ncbi:MAG: hypothetical protein M1830_000206, partial [Pleopsidium flavum]
AEHLVGYSTAQPSIFKTGQLASVKDLKLLVKDYAPISKNALTILINISDDREVLEFLAKDVEFLETLLVRITNAKEPNANEIAMLLANMAKSSAFKRILTVKRDVPTSLSTSNMAMDQLMDCFVKGAEGGYNKHADFDYLAYFFADLAKVRHYTKPVYRANTHRSATQYSEGREYFVTRQAYDSIIPITKLIVFTEHKSSVRRKGVASTIKNVAFDISPHSLLLSQSDVNLLPYILLPITGPEEFPDEETLAMLPDLQLLPPDKARDSDPQIILTHLETLLLLTTTRDGRDLMREVKVYPIIRETHLHVDDEEVRDAADRLVQVLMRDEEDNGSKPEGFVQEEDEDEKIIEIF